VRKGFTLLEVMVALLIFSVVAVMLAEGLHLLIRTQSSLTKKADQLEDLQMAFLLMENNLSQTIDRPIAIEKKIRSSAFVGDSTMIEFTHGGYINPEGQFPRSTLQRTAYLIQHGALIKRDWPVLDRDAKTMPTDRTLIKNLNLIQFRFIDQHKNFYNNWPSESGLPRAVQLTLTFSPHDKIIWVLMIKGQKLGK